MSKMDKKTLKPRIRFANFTDAWEQRKYEDIGTPSSGGTLGYDDLAVNGEYNCVLYGELYTHHDCLIKEIQNKTNCKGNTVQRNDVLFPQSTTVDALSLISPACLNVDTAETSGVFVIRPHKDIDGNFVAYYTKGNNYQRQKLSKKAQGLTIVHLYYQSIKDETIAVPTFTEQKRISTFFENLDNLITLHQRKLEKLSNVKKSLLEKMFPQKNSTTPKVRFKGFTDAWEQRKYEDIGTPSSGGTLGYDDLAVNGEYNCVLYGELYTHHDCLIKEIQNKTNCKGNTVQRNDVLFPQSTTVDALSLISPACLNVDTAETSGVFVIRPHKDIDGNFVAYYTKGNNYQRQKLSKKAQGLTIVHLYYQSIKDETIAVPTFTEQKRISTFFENLDNLITLHQRKLEKLKNVKKALLEKMFV